MLKKILIILALLLAPHPASAERISPDAIKSRINGIDSLYFERTTTISTEPATGKDSITEEKIWFKKPQLFRKELFSSAPTPLSMIQVLTPKGYAIFNSSSGTIERSDKIVPWDLFTPFNLEGLSGGVPFKTLGTPMGSNPEKRCSPKALS